MEEEDTIALKMTGGDEFNLSTRGGLGKGPIATPGGGLPPSEGVGAHHHRLEDSDGGLPKMPLSEGQDLTRRTCCLSHNDIVYSECKTTSRRPRNNEDKISCWSSSRRRSNIRICSVSLWGFHWPLPLRTLWVCCLWVLFATPTNICADSNGCDFYGSGLEQDGRGVQPVYLSCASGRVEWQYPRAGLRVILKSPHKDKDFHACIKADKKFEGARIYLEGHRSLLPLFAANDGRPNDLVRCFTSYKGQAALYVEAEQGASDNLKKQVAAFEYDLQSTSKGVLYDPLEECRPCSEEELLRLYCSADFVARGTIIGAEDDSRLGRTTITVRASKLFQQTSHVFRHSSGKKNPGQGVVTPAQSHTPKHAHNRFDYSLMEEEANALVEEVGYVGHVDMPIQCHAKAGEGEFLVMGVVRLGQPILKCAPRHSEWVKIAKTAHSRAQCVIET